MFKFIRRLSISRKLTLVSLSFLIPDFVLMCLFLVTINGYLDFAQQELNGNEFQRPLEELVDYLPQHLQLARRISAGDTASADQLTRVQTQIDVACDRLLAVDGRLGETLQFTDAGLKQRHRDQCRANLVVQEWQKIKESVRDLENKTFETEHLRLIANIRAMISHAGDTSNLILDPDLDSYYLMDITLLALPQMQDRLATALLKGESCLRHRVITSEQQSELLVYAAMLQEADLDRILASARTALNEDQALYGISDSLQRRLPPALDRFDLATRKFIALTAQLGNNETADIQPEDFVAAGTDARQAGAELWEVGVEELDTLIALRMSHFRHRRALSLLLACSAFTAAITLVTFITRSISGPLQKQANELNRLYTETELLLSSITSVLIHLDRTGIITRWNAAAESVFGLPAVDIIGRSCRNLPWLDAGIPAQLEQLARQGGAARLPHVLVTGSEHKKRVLDLSVNPICDGGQCSGLLVLGDDRTEQEQLEASLRQAQKLESIGSLAAGIAHEINTPMQFINDNMAYLGGCANSILEVVDEYRRILETADPNISWQEIAAEVARTIEEKDFDSMQQEVPSAIQESIEGIERVIHIVKAMKEFSHPGQETKCGVDLNQSIRSTVTITKSRWKFLADVKLDLDPDLPTLVCFPGEINQVLVNLIVNAADAIADRFGDSGPIQGAITVRTLRDQECFVVEVEDNGCGVPMQIRDRIFDPFFTTKDVGKGTGQGLSVCYSIVVNKHQGTLEVESTQWVGSVFRITLPPSAEGESFIEPAAILTEVS
jgi:signal transduction histidine kinase